MTIPVCTHSVSFIEIDLSDGINHTYRKQEERIEWRTLRSWQLDRNYSLGQIVDTNSTWMAQRLTALGVNLFYKAVVGDNPERMREVLTRALERADVVITSGGLGPTQDDLTREVVAEVTGRKLVLHPPFLEQIEHRFRTRGFIMTPE